ncbi:Flp family type IVb pilin [Pimelobacter simplex]|uniref:Flp family type IVb pilin n=1 Tax=Nocardioides simplex TaxID=2045 RepID=UPI003AAD331E
MTTTTAATAPGAERGASAVEYALLIALIAAVIFGAVALFGGGVADLFTSTNNSLDGVVSP